MTHETINIIAIVLVILALDILLFLIFRNIILWYFKINTIVKNQKQHQDLLTRQNELLEGIYKQLGGVSKQNKSTHNPLIEKTKEASSKINNKISSQFSHKEQFEEDNINHLRKDIKDNEIIIRVKHNNRIEKWNIKDWEEIIKIGNRDKFEILYSKDGLQ